MALLVFRCVSVIDNKEFKQKRRWWLQKCHFKKSIRAPSNFIELIPPRLIRQMRANFFGVEFLRSVYQISGKEKENWCLVFPSLTKREIRHFHVVVLQRRLRNVQKSVMQVQSCCFANITDLLHSFSPFSLPLVKHPIVDFTVYCKWKLQ